MKVYLTVDAWISVGSSPEIPFGAHDSRNRPWYRVLPAEYLTCVDCGRPVSRGWKRGLKAKTAVCDLCVSLTDPHRRD
jgi:hypothetical protein